MKLLRDWSGDSSVIPQCLRDSYALATEYAHAGLEQTFREPPSYDTVGWSDLLRDMEARFGGVTGILGESALREVEEYTRQRLKDIRNRDPFNQRWAVDSILAHCCYLVCRLLKPEIVLETGVAYGVSSAFILRALKENGRGVLHSVDLPPLRRKTGKFWGIMVDEELESRWYPHRGPSKLVLPHLVEEIGMLDIFIHDSVHTYRNMLRELATIWPRLRSGGMVVADDIERNGAFAELQRWGPVFSRVVQDREKRPLHGRAAPIVFGVVVK
jgi:predicted O-methyltransferase YrrM